MSYFKSLGLFAIAAATIFSIATSGVISHASSPGTTMTTTSSVNLRDARCTKIGVMPSGSSAVTYVDDVVSVDCSINGVGYSYTHLKFSNGVIGWVANNFLTAAQINNANSTSGTRFKTNYSVNLRGSTCERIGSIAGGSVGTVKQKVGYCSINGIQYNMVYVQFDNGTRANVAETFITYM